MKKYLLVSENSFHIYFAYRLSFLLWRMRSVLFVLINYYLWLAVSSQASSIFGYNQRQILTYILLTTVVAGIVFSTQTSRVAEEIRDGSLSSYLLRPVNYFLYNIFRDIPDKVMNIFFSIIEVLLLIFLLHPPFYMQSNLAQLFLFLFSLFFASIMYFEIMMILSFLGFWVHEVWAPRFLFFILVTFLAGNYFPLNIFPDPIFKIFEFLPFSYLIYFPIKIYLGLHASGEIMRSFFVMTLWIVLLYQIMVFLWKKGLRQYTAVGQ